MDGLQAVATAQSENLSALPEEAIRESAAALCELQEEVAPKFGFVSVLASRRPWVVVLWIWWGWGWGWGPRTWNTA